MSIIYNEQVWRSEIEYRREQGIGRLSPWARTEGRREPLLRKPFRRAHKAAAADC